MYQLSTFSIPNSMTKISKIKSDDYHLFQYISSKYNEEPGNYTKECQELDQLREVRSLFHQYDVLFSFLKRFPFQFIPVFYTKFSSVPYIGMLTHRALLNTFLKLNDVGRICLSIYSPRHHFCSNENVRSKKFIFPILSLANQIAFHWIHCYSSDVINILDINVFQSATKVSTDFMGCSVLKKYYAQLCFLQSRFPLIEGDDFTVEFSWWATCLLKLFPLLGKIAFES